MTPPPPSPGGRGPTRTAVGRLRLQHVLALYAGAVAVPLIVGGAMKLSPGPGVSDHRRPAGVRDRDAHPVRGLLAVGVRLPIMQGCTFAAVSPMVLIGTSGGGLPAIYGSVIVAGLAIMLLAPVFGRLLRFFPPLVTGTVI